MKTIHIICPFCKESNIMPVDKRDVACSKCGSLLNANRRKVDRKKIKKK